MVGVTKRKYWTGDLKTKQARKEEQGECRERKETRFPKRHTNETKYKKKMQVKKGRWEIREIEIEKR